MIRVIFGSAVASVAMFVISLIFFGPLGLSNLGTRNVDDGQAAAVQQALAANLPRTGTYFVPEPGASAAQTVMYGQGPIATIHYNTAGFPATDPTALIGGLVFNFLVALTIGAALIGIDRRVPDFPSRARVAVLIAVAAATFTRLGEPIYNHHDWGHFIYLFVADALALGAAGLILAYFLPVSRAGPEDAPTDV
ncbi:hypothetical protein [Sphingosinicella sp. CPCC 101087]|uniref:hypothetical protein n=1 Tax=Sphingosinicella sp. CPCC 101087 TaxID=2497754 RepID=UPI00101D89AF|nr:hypothetical protein [Sphingosinicella sp. CPCC 101087]